MPMRGPRSPSTHTRLAHIDMWCGYMVVGHSAFSGQYVFLAAICNANEASHTLHSDQYETIQVNIKFSIYLYFFYLYIFLIFYGGGGGWAKPDTVSVSYLGAAASYLHSAAAYLGSVYLRSKESKAYYLRPTWAGAWAELVNLTNLHHSMLWYFQNVTRKIKLFFLYLFLFFNKQLVWYRIN